MYSEARRVMVECLVDKGGGSVWEEVCGTGGEIHGRRWKVEDVGCVVCVMQSRTAHDTRACQGCTLVG